jgi:nicotinamidase-related amidase
MLSGARHPAVLDRSASAVLVIDMQSGFRPYVPRFDTVTRRIELLLRGARLLGVPIAASEQYPHGLGATAPELVDAAGGSIDAFAKVEFAACSAEGWQQLPVAVRDASQVVLVGIEAHVCVRQTALALLADERLERHVHVCVDAVASAADAHRDVAVRELARAGVHETTVEQALFDWLGAAGSEEFRALQQLLRDVDDDS